MFDASLCPADALQQITDLRRKLIAIQVENLCALGHARDIELLFFANDTCRPDWRFVDDLDDDAQKIVREIFDLSHDVARAEDELELRARPGTDMAITGGLVTVAPR
jgi:hypothetical protein